MGSSGVTRVRHDLATEQARIGQVRLVVTLAGGDPGREPRWAVGARNIQALDLLGTGCGRSHQTGQVTWSTTFQ